MHTSFLMDPIDRVSPRGIKVDPYSCFYLNTFCIVFSHTEEQYASSEQKQTKNQNKKKPTTVILQNEFFKLCLDVTKDAQTLESVRKLLFFPDAFVF